MWLFIIANRVVLQLASYMKFYFNAAKILSRIAFISPKPFTKTCLGAPAKPLLAQSA